MTPDRDRNDQQLQDSVSKLFDAELPEEEFEELSRRLREDPKAREVYFECAALGTALDLEFAPPLSRGG